MSSAHQQLIHALGKEDNSESMDVLLQLTLPIILILAFVVASELQSLKAGKATAEAEAAELAQRNQELDEEIGLLTQELDGTETGRLAEALDITLLSLQQQLLLKATEQVLAEQRQQLELDVYAQRRPAVDDLLSGQLPPGFAATSVALGDLFNGRDGLRRSERYLGEQVLERFRELVDEVFPAGQVSDYRRRRLTTIAPENRLAFSAQLSGGLRGVQQEASQVQLELLLAWLMSPAADVAVKDRSTDTWRAIQRSEEDDIVRARVDDFVNLKTVALLVRFEALQVPLLDATCLEALSQPCGEVL